LLLRFFCWVALRFREKKITTIFVDTRLWKTKHSRKPFKKFPSIIHVIDMSDQNPPITATSVTFYAMLAGCDWWISIRHVDSMYDLRKFWKCFRECFVFQSCVSTKTVVRKKRLCYDKPGPSFVIIRQGKPLF